VDGKSLSPGFIQNARIDPKSNRPMLPRNGRFQFPVLSMTYPKIRGEIMAAKGDPIFMRPLAEPEYSGAISMGIAHIGPIVNSEKKKATLRQIAASIRLRTKRIGIIAVSEQRKPPITKLRRAVLRFPVMISIRSLTIPPKVAPKTPAKKTPAEKSAEFLKSSR